MRFVVIIQNIQALYTSNSYKIMNTTQQSMLSTQLQNNYVDYRLGEKNQLNTQSNNNKRQCQISFMNTKQRYPLFKYLIVFLTVVVNCQCTQMQIISQPNQEQLKAINLMRSLRRYRKRIINLNNDTYVCVTAVKQKPTDQSSDGTDRAKITAQYANGNVPAYNTLKVDPTLYESSLDLLDDDIGVRHHTKQFIYGYKHKKIVTQYDDQTTKIMNQKKELQNFTLGLFSVSLLQTQKPPGTKVQLLYLTYQNSHIYTNNPIEHYYNQTEVPLKERQSQYAQSRAYIDYENSLITLSNPLEAAGHARQKAYNVTFLCHLAAEQGIREQNYNRTIIGISLSNYQIMIIRPIPKECFKVIDIVKSKNDALSTNKHNIYDNKLNGDLDKFCQVGYDNGINVGDYILLQTERVVESVKKVSTNKNTKPSQKVEVSIKQNPLSGQQFVQVQPIPGRHIPAQQTITDYFVIRIDQIIGQDLYLISKKLPWTLKPVKCKKLQRIPYKVLDYTGHIDVKEVEVYDNQKILNFQSYKIIQFDYKGSNLIKIDDNYLRNHNKLKTGLQLFCLTKIAFSIAPEHPIFHNFGFTIGKKFSNNYYQVHPWINNNLIQKFNQIGEFKGKTTCVPYRYGKESQQVINTISNSISKTLKMSKNINSRIKIDQSENKVKQDSIFSFTLTKDAVVEITTSINQQIEQKDIQNTNKKEIKEKGTNKYYISSHKLYKVETIFKNGSKIRVERAQNEFYQNNTNQYMVVVYKSIWRAADFVKFPRFLFHPQERITGIIVKHGTAFVRVVEVNDENRQLYAVSSSSLTNKNNGFGPKVRPQKSIGTQFKFSWGAFCGGAINRHRQTMIKLKCGYSWFKINSVLEVAPCSYEINAVSQFLCDQNVVFPALKQGFNVFNGSVCIPGDFYKSM